MDIIIIALLAAVLITGIVILLCVNKKNDSTDPNIDELKLRLDTVDIEIKNLSRKNDDFSRMTGDEFQRNRAETAVQLKEMNRLIVEMQELNTRHSNRTNEVLTDCVTRLQESNEKKLDQMRQTVDEKLTTTLSQRLDSSFKVVGDQLEKVYGSIGEMKKLADGVNDLQRVLTNVKARGTWGEVQLGNILEQTLTSDEYEQNYAVRGREMVEYAVKIPSKTNDKEIVRLPIDSKFPVEDYIRICEAAEKVDKVALDEAVKALERRIRDEAKKIRDKYINVPETTDFGIMFLPTEGLYAEVLRRPGLCEEVQNKFKIMICGPTTITAFLNTLRVGFRTIAIDKKTSEIKEILAAVKSQYSIFEENLRKAGNKLNEAANTIDAARKRNGIIVKKLKSVDEIKSGADDILGIGSASSYDLQE